MNRIEFYLLLRYTHEGLRANKYIHNIHTQSYTISINLMKIKKKSEINLES